jgi:hypothetical protein
MSQLFDGTDLVRYGAGVEQMQERWEVAAMHVDGPVPVSSSPADQHRRPETGRGKFVIPGGALLALAMSLRARGLRGLDILRPSQDRAPPARV